MTIRKCQSILFVDDDRDVCVAVRAALCMVPGLDLTTARSGEACIDLAYALRPDLIVLDLLMPGRDGLTTHRMLRENPLIENTPVIFMATIRHPSEVASLLALGAIGVIAKPIDPLRLVPDLAEIWEKSLASVPSPAVIVDTLAQQFLERTAVDVERIRSLAITACADGDSLTEIAHIAHAIHGTGAMVGYAAVSEFGGALQRFVESFLEYASEPRQPLPPFASARLQERIEDLARSLAAAHSMTPSTSAMFQC